MKESIKVRSFLVIKKADIELKKINIIIGPQANGKSLIAKLVYFFQSMSSKYIEGIRTQSTKRDVDKEILLDFESRFPRYSWEGTAFIIDYHVDGIHVSIVGEKNARGKTNLSIAFSENLIKVFNVKKKLFKRKYDEYKEQEKPLRRYNNPERQIMYEYITDPLKSEDFGAFFCDSVFVPASRSFFANLQKNIFTFLASNLDIDPFLKEFGSLYESSKRLYREDYFSRNNKILFDDLRKVLDSIVSGDYEYHSEQDWIASKGKRVNLANASSGQQESLPMLLVLCVWPMIKGREKGSMFFIEEPEAHLFPTSQSHVISALSLLYNKVGTRFFVTSHSPYILSALNNFILAGDMVGEGKVTEEEFVAINGAGSSIRFEDVSAYTIVNGVAESIADDDYRMIGGELLDNVSEHFEDVLNKLLALGE